MIYVKNKYLHLPVVSFGQRYPNGLRLDNQKVFFVHQVLWPDFMSTFLSLNLVIIAKYNKQISWSKLKSKENEFFCMFIFVTQNI